MSRTGVLLAFAATAWAVGGVVAMENRWHPFAGSHMHHGEQIRVYMAMNGHEARAAGRFRSHGVPIRLTPAEQRMLPPGLAAGVAEDVLSAIAARELGERTASHADIVPGSRMVRLSDQIISVELKSHPGYDLGVLWPGVAARLEAAGHLPRHGHWPAESVTTLHPARRGIR